MHQLYRHTHTISTPFSPRPASGSHKFHAHTAPANQSTNDTVHTHTPQIPHPYCPTNAQQRKHPTATHATPGPPTLTTLTPTHRRCRSTDVDAAPVGSQLDRPDRQDQSTHSQLNRPGTRQTKYRFRPDQIRHQTGRVQDQTRPNQTGQDQFTRSQLNRQAPDRIRLNQTRQTRLGQNRIRPDYTKSDQIGPNQTESVHPLAIRQVRHRIRLNQTKTCQTRQDQIRYQASRNLTGRVPDRSVIGQAKYRIRPNQTKPDQTKSGQSRILTPHPTRPAGRSLQIFLLNQTANQSESASMPSQSLQAPACWQADCWPKV